MDKLFHLSENETNVRTEIVAGITTFMTMAYILAVNPNILSASGMDRGAVFTATALASMLASFLMAAFANYPFVLAPGMGLNAYFAYTVVLQMGYSWQMALAAVFVEGVIFIVLSLTNVREAIFNAIPLNLKAAVSTGIGLFIAFIGLQNAKIVVDSATLVAIYPIKASLENGTFRSEGITVLLAMLGILVTAFLMVKQVKGGILWGILITWLMGIICELTGFYVPDPALGTFSVLPDFSQGFGIQDMSPTFMKLDFSKVLSLEFGTVVFAFLFVDMFDTLGTLIGVAQKADMLDKEGKLPRGYLRGRRVRHFHHHHVCGERFRRGCRRAHRPYRCRIRPPVRTFPVPCPHFPGDSLLCDSSGSRGGGIPDDHVHPAGEFLGLYRSGALLHLHDRHALHVQYLGRYRPGCDLLCGAQSPDRRSEDQEDQPHHVRPGGTVLPEIFHDLRQRRFTAISSF